MVFAELLGGMINRGGEKFREAELRRHALENWQRENDLQLTSNFLTQNYGNLSPDQIGGLTGRIEKLTGMKAGSLGAMIPVAQAIHQFIPPQPSAPNLGQPRTGNFDTPLSPTEEAQFQQWKARYAPRDTGEDYDLRGAFKAGLTPDPVTGHWPDTFKKPNHPTFSNESQYAGAAPGLAGSWQGPNRDVYTQAPAPPSTTIASPNFTTPIQTRQFGAIAPANKFAGQSIAEPQQIQIGQIPTPAEIATPSIFAPQPGYMAKSEPRLQMTPNQILARQRTEQDQADLEQKVNNIMNSPYLDDRAKMVAIRSLYTPPGVIAAEERQTSGPSAVGLGVIEFVSPDGKQRIYAQPTRGGGFLNSMTGQLIDPTTLSGWTKLYNQSVQLIPNAAGGLDAVNRTRLGQRMNQDQTVVGEVAGVQPASANPQSQLQQITTAQGPSVVSFTPSRTGPGTTQTVIPNAVKGNVPPLSEAEQTQIKGLTTSAQTLDQLRNILPSVKTGPIWGRLRNVQMQYLGGFGTTPEERDVALKIRTMLISAFDTAGKNFTESEKRTFQGYNPQDTDTVETALSKIDNALDFINNSLQVRQGLLSPSQKPFYQMPNVPKSRSKTKAAGVGGGNTPPPAGGDTVNIRLPNGQTGTIPRANLAEAKRRGAVEVP